MVGCIFDGYVEWRWCCSTRMLNSRQEKSFKKSRGFWWTCTVGSIVLVQLRNSRNVTSLQPTQTQSLHWVQSFLMHKLFSGRHHFLALSIFGSAQSGWRLFQLWWVELQIGGMHLAQKRNGLGNFDNAAAGCGGKSKAATSAGAVWGRVSPPFGWCRLVPSGSGCRYNSH